MTFTNLPSQTPSSSRCLEPQVIDIDATTLIHGHGNIVSPEATLIGARIAATLAHIFQGHQGDGGDEGEDDYVPARPVKIRVRCGLTVAGTKNFVGSAVGVPVRRAVDPRAAAPVAGAGGPVVVTQAQAPEGDRDSTRVRGSEATSKSGREEGSPARGQRGSESPLKRKRDEEDVRLSNVASIGSSEKARRADVFS